MKNKSIPIEERNKEYAKKSANLWLTREAFKFWVDTLHRGYRALIDEAEVLLRAAARDDWGDGTECIFNEDARSIEVEHLDGRKMKLEKND